MITAIIIDDETKGRLVLREKIKAYCPDVKILAEAENGKEGLELLKSLVPDIIFLDVEMPEMTGFEMLQHYHGKAHIIFTTAYNQYAIKAIKHGAFDYLLKPIDIEELKQTIHKIVLSGNQTKDHLIKSTPVTRLSIPSLEGFKFIYIKDIVYLEADSNYTTFYLYDGSKVISSKTMKEYESLLTENSFFRSHHSYLINLHFVSSYIKTDGDQIIMTTGAKLYLSRRRKQDFLEAMNRMNE